MLQSLSYIQTLAIILLQSNFLLWEGWMMMLFLPQNATPLFNLIKTSQVMLIVDWGTCMVCVLLPIFQLPPLIDHWYCLVAVWEKSDKILHAILMCSSAQIRPCNGWPVKLVMINMRGTLSPANQYTRLVILDATAIYLWYS